MNSNGSIKVPIKNHDQEPTPIEKDDRRTILMNKLRVIPGMGLLMAFLSGIVFASAGFTVELMDEVDPAFIVSFRSFVQLVFFLPLCLYLKDPIIGVEGERFALFQRGFFGHIAFTCTYYAFSYVSLSDASSIVFSAPVFVSIFACFILGENCGVFQITTIITTLIGIFLISRPAFIFGSEVDDVFSLQERIIGTILSLVASLSVSYTYVTIRRLQKTPTSVVITFFSIWCIIAGSLTMNVSSYLSNTVTKLPSSLQDWLLALVNGLCGVIGQSLLVVSLK